MDDENPDREARDRAERIALDEAIGDEAMPCPWWRWQPDATPAPNTEPPR